jgi:hypothetical protein
MGLFGRRRQQVRDNVNDMEKAIAVISGRLRFLEALTSHLVAELSPKKRDSLLEQVREEVVGGLKVLPPPRHVPPGREQEFYDELSRAMNVLIEQTTKRGPTDR